MSVSRSSRTGIPDSIGAGLMAPGKHPLVLGCEANFEQLTVNRMDGTSSAAASRLNFTPAGMITNATTITTADILKRRTSAPFERNTRNWTQSTSRQTHRKKKHHSF